MRHTESADGGRWARESRDLGTYFPLHSRRDLRGAWQFFAGHGPAAALAGVAAGVGQFFPLAAGVHHMGSPDWHVFQPDDYCFGTGPLKLQVTSVLRADGVPAGWVMVEGVEFDWRGEPVDRARRATVRISALRAAGVKV